MAGKSVVDINCDMGESYGVYRLGQDQELLRYVSSVSIACGFHAGDPSVMRETIALARAAKVSIGAHPGYPDLMGFGRRIMQLSPTEVFDAIVYQVGAFLGVAKSLGVAGTHVKAHGALYNLAVSDVVVAQAVAQAVRAVDDQLILVGLANSRLIEAGLAQGLRVSREAFVDRRYQADGSLVPRSHPHALYHSFGEARDQVKEILTTGFVTAITGEKVPVVADTFCVHGEGPHALEFARGMVALVAEQNITLSGLKRL
ncbi:MAG: hypothetical protein DDT35_00034 [Firmicutes bacterium]|nr:hypothetical protein [Bacillota bacterium]